MIRNARTFPDELRDRDGFTIDLDALAEFPSSVLLTVVIRARRSSGGSSPDWWRRCRVRG